MPKHISLFVFVLRSCVCCLRLHPVLLFCRCVGQRVDQYVRLRCEIGEDFLLSFFLFACVSKAAVFKVIAQEIH